jgi:type I restriction enzyme S subunit
VVPPLGEQIDIVNHLDQELAGMDEVLDRTRREIQLASEYHTRLVADVVTGKLDVRNIEITDVAVPEAQISGDEDDELENEDLVGVEEGEDAINRHY